MDSQGHLNIAELYSGKYTAKQRDAILKRGQQMSAVRISHRSNWEKLKHGIKRIGNKVVHGVARVGEKFGEISGAIAGGIATAGAAIAATGIGAPIGVLMEAGAAGLGAVSAVAEGLGKGAKFIESRTRNSHS